MATKVGQHIVEDAPAPLSGMEVGPRGEMGPAEPVASEAVELVSKAPERAAARVVAAKDHKVVPLARKRAATGRRK